MSKSLNSNQAQKVDRPYLQPIYFVHLLNVGAGETLYLSDRAFAYNGHDYEDYLIDLPNLAQAINRWGGYLNIQASLKFKNERFRSYNTLLEFFGTNPITLKFMELYVLYVDTGEVFGSDVSTKLAKLGIGELREITRQSFSADLCTMLHRLDLKKVLPVIDTEDYPNADPKAVGKLSNQIYGSVQDVPCHCIKTGAYSTVVNDVTKAQTTIKLSSVLYPIQFPASGSVVINEEQIRYGSLNTEMHKLLDCTRGYNGTTAAPHKEGSPVLGVLGNYKWQAAGHICKAVNNVYVDRVLIPDTDYTVDLNDNGKTTIQFGSRQILKHQGTHGHPVSVTKEIRPSTVSLSPSPIDVAWNFKGPLGNVKDQDESTYMRLRSQGQGVPQVNDYCVLRVNFPTYSGPKPEKIYVVIIHNSEYTIATTGSYVQLNYPSQVNLQNSASKVTQRILISGTAVPAYIKIRWQAKNSGLNYQVCSSLIYEVRLEVEYTGTGAAAASGVYSRMDDVFAPLVTADVDGYKDDGSGTYTGTANALIENPADVRHHFLRSVLGVDPNDIDISGLQSLRATYSGRITGGYKTVAVLNLISEKPSEIMGALDRETRSQTREDGGKFYCSFHPDTISGWILTITKDNIYGEPVFGQTSIEEIKNKLRAKYKVDWGGREANNRYLSNFEKITKTSDATSITKYGELIEDLEFVSTKKQTHVEDVLAWLLKQKKDVLRTVSLVCDYSARILEKNDNFYLVWDFWSDLKWRILDIKEIPYQQKFQIKGIEAV